MDYNYFRSLLLTHTFFELFKSIKYKKVPVARAMAYSFHRNAVDFFSSKKIAPPKNWIGQKKLLYNLLIKNDPVIKIPYHHRSKHHHKIIYSSYSIEGLRVNPKESLVLGRSEVEKRRLRGVHVPFFLPEKMASLNKNAYLVLMGQFKKIIRLDGVPLYFKTNRFFLWFANQLQSVMKSIDGIEKVFSLYSIRGIVLHSSVHPLGYLLVHMGKQRGIPTINLQYGLNDDYQLFSTYVDDYVAWGGIHKKRLTRYGVPESKFSILGNARFDPIFTVKWKMKNQLAKRLHLPADKTLFFYPDQAVSAQKNKKVMNVILNALLPYQNQVVLLVKDHPRQKTSSLPPDYSNKYPFVRKVTGKSVRLYDILNSADAVFVQFSTVGIEALMFNTPIFIISLFPDTPKHEYTYYSASKFMVSARNQQQLNQIVRQFMSDSSYKNSVLKKQKKYLRAAYHGTLSANRIKQFIQEKTK